MELTLENFELSIAIISGRFSSSANIPAKGITAIGWQSDETPTMNEARELAEKYISIALQDLSSGLFLVSSELSTMSEALRNATLSMQALDERVKQLEGTNGLPLG